MCLLTTTQVQIVVNVTVHAPMFLREYPYDRHVIPFCLGTRTSKNADGEWKNQRRLCEERPDWAPAHCPTDMTMLSRTTPDFEYDYKNCFVYMQKNTTICVLIERPTKHILKRVAALPLFIVGGISLAVSITEYENESVLAVLLSLMAFSFAVSVSVQSSLPKLIYLTWADIYFLVRENTPADLRPPPTHPTIHPTALSTPSASVINSVSRQVCLGLHLVIIFKVIVASQMCLDTSDNSNRSFVLGDTACQERNHALTIFLAILWLLLHVILFLDTKFPSIVTKHVRLAAPRKMS